MVNPGLPMVNPGVQNMQPLLDGLRLAGGETIRPPPAASPAKLAADV